MLDQGYGMMPNKVLFDKELSDKAKLLFCLISSLCAEKGYCRAGNEYISEKMGMSERTVREHISILVQHKYITLVVEKGNQRKITIGTVADGCHVGGETTPSVGGETTPHNIISNNNIKEKGLSEKLKEFGLEDEVIQVAIEFNKYKIGPKISKFDKGQLKRWVNKLKKDGLNCKEGMIATLEKSIASGYQGTTPIKPREIKTQQTQKINTVMLH